MPFQESPDFRVRKRGQVIEDEVLSMRRLAAALGISPRDLELTDALQVYKRLVVDKCNIKSFAGLGFVELQKRELDSFYVSPKATLRSFCPLPKTGDQEHSTGAGTDRVAPFARDNGFAKKPGDAAAQVLGEMRAVVLGPPGSGKTTLVQYLARQSAGGRFRAIEIPIVVRLPEFALAIKRQPEIDFVDWIVSRAEELECHGLDGPLRELLGNHASNVIFLLDGLDEVPDMDNLHEQVVSSIEEFVQDHPTQRYVITSRPAGFDEVPWGRLDFRRLDLQDYADDEIRQVVKKWSVILAGKEDETAESVERDLSHAIFENERVRTLASNPLILTILIFLSKSRGYALPRRRVDLYAKVAEVFLDSWEANKRKETGYRETRSIDLDTRELGWLIADLALGMQRACMFNVPRWWIVDRLQETLCRRIGFSVDDAKVQIEPILRFVSMRAGLLEERLPDVFAFGHRTIQEYFASLGVIEEAENSEKPTALPSLLRSHLFDPSWNEVIRLVTAQVNPTRAEALLKTIVDDPDPLGRFLQRSDLLALQCLADGATISNRKLTDTIFETLPRRADSKWLGITLDILKELHGLVGTRHQQMAEATRESILAEAKSKLSPAEYHTLVFGSGEPVDIEFDESTPESSSAVLRAKIRCRDLVDDAVLPNVSLIEASPKRWWNRAREWRKRKRLGETEKRAIYSGITMAAFRDETMCAEAIQFLKSEIEGKKDARLRAVALRAYRHIARKNIDWEFLLQRFLDNREDELVRSWAARALHRTACEHAQIRARLLRFLNDKSIGAIIRTGVADGLSDTSADHPEVSESLVKIASSSQEPESLVRASIWALEPVAKENLETFKRWASQNSFRARPACQVLSLLYLKRKISWESLRLPWLHRGWRRPVM